MSGEQRFWTIVTVVAGLCLVGRAVWVGNGRQYIETVTVPAVEDGAAPTTQTLAARPVDRDQPGVSLSWSRTIGTWLAALCTLAIFSFLFGETPLYKVAESIFVGVSAAYYMVQAFWTEIVENLLANLIPDLMRATVLPGLPSDAEPNYLYVIPLILSIMMLWRLSPKGAWIARWPLAFFIGATAGMRLVSHLESDFLRQIGDTIAPLVVFVPGQGVDVWASVKNTITAVGVLMGLVYFFFSVEHKGVIGAAARGGVWLLMITFGASFGYTVMGRVALLADRLEFLFNDWLWIIDPAGNRLGM